MEPDVAATMTRSQAILAGHREFVFPAVKPLYVSYRQTNSTITAKHQSSRKKGYRLPGTKDSAT